MVWCGMAWYSMVGMLCYGMIRYFTVGCNTVWYDTILCGMIRCDTIRCDVMRYGSAWARRFARRLNMPTLLLPVSKPSSLHATLVSFVRVVRSFGP